VTPPGSVAASGRLSPHARRERPASRRTRRAV
jgi:hypothetical protein